MKKAKLPDRFDQFLTGKKTLHIDAATGVPAHSEVDSEEERGSEPDSPVIPEDEGKLSDRDYLKEDLDQEISEEANYWGDYDRVWSFMSWHQVPEFDTSSSSFEDNTFDSVMLNPPPINLCFRVVFYYCK